MTETRMRFVTKQGEQVQVSGVVDQSGVSTPAYAQSSNEVSREDKDLEKAGECAGEWTRAIATLANAPYQMNIVNATGWQDMLPRARKCRNDVTGANWYSSPVLICAPYIRCTA